MIKDFTGLQGAIAGYKAKTGLVFKPGAEFYSRVGINRKRFGMLVQGQARIYGDEARTLAEYFGVPITDLL